MAASVPDRPSWGRRTAAKLWRYRREIAVGVVVAATAGVPLCVPAGRRRLGAALRHARTRRGLVAAFTELRLANSQGQMPRIRRVEETAFGQRVHLRARAGHWFELLEVRAPVLAAATRSMAVRVERDPNDASRIALDVVRCDPLARVGDVEWLSVDDGALSMWDPIHLGTTEGGVPLWTSLVERSVLVGGMPRSGKSNFLRIIATHAAKSPDVEMLLIDPNRVQFSPWRDRALAFADNDPVAACAVLEQVAVEIDRRLDLLTTLPGVPDKVTPEIGREYGMPPWLLMIDELAYHTATAGTSASRARFAGLLRDIVARGQAALIIAVVATQRPTDKIVPRDLGDLFSIRVAFSVMSGGNSDVILGDGWAKRGFNAGDIGLDSAGTAYLLADGGKPVKFKAARIPADVIADLAVTTPVNKPGARRLRSVAA